MHSGSSLQELMRRAHLACTLVVAGVLAGLRPGYAQVDSGERIPEVTQTYALVNARVVQAPGQILDRATVVIRDGLIVRVAPGADIPFDAERIAADSLSVYAGFIDGLSHAGIPEPKDEPDRERPEDPGNPPDSEAGIQPDRDVRTMLDASDKRIRDLRAIGFTAAHVVPRGRMLPGKGAVILLAEGSANDLVVRGDASTYAQLAPARRMYPATDMAVLAKWRQVYRDARRARRIEQLYRDNPVGLERPRYNPAHYALFPVIGGTQPVFFLTEGVLDLYRTLALQDELGFPLVIAGLEQSYAALDVLKTAGHPLILTLGLPKKPDAAKEPESPETPAPADAPAELPRIAELEYDASFRTLSHLDIAAEKKNLEARRQKEYERHAGNAALLYEEDLAFAFTSLDTEPANIAGNIRTMIEHGLPEEAALEALTTEPASILGVSAVMGTVEPGKMANLVVTDGPVFDEDSKVRMVFVYGQKFEFESAPADTASSDLAVEGTWSFVVSGPDGDVRGKIVLEERQGAWTGNITHEMSSTAFALGSIEVIGNKVSFTFDEPNLGPVAVSLTVTGDRIEGSVTAADLDAMSLAGDREPEQ